MSTVKAQQTDSTRQTTKKTKTKKKTTSSQRIPITKESPGEVSPTPTVNQDSIAAAERARQDSIAAAAERARQEEIARAEQMRRDSIAAAERRKQDSIAAVERARQDSIARADSIAAAERARISWMRKHGGWYFGIAAGASIPTGSMTNSGFNSGGYSTGWDIMVPIGYDFDKSILGFRLDGTFDQLNGKDFNTNFSAPNMDVWSANLDLRLRVPLGRTFSRFYMLGGATYSGMNGWFTDFSDPNNPTNKQSTQGDWGWNAGAGFNFNWGYMIGLFLESRYVWVNQNSVSGFPYTHAAWVPIVLGVTF
ncbi:MAG TPA: outer membrane beta-barrel protein [Gemmatimonadaceae bacterium]